MGGRPFGISKSPRENLSNATKLPKYDQRRRGILPQDGIDLVELDCNMFQRKRLFRDEAKDEAVIRRQLIRFLSGFP
jgi:hypothetical protein